jgi:hypothetical protein
MIKFIKPLPSINPVNCWDTLRAKDATAWLVTASANAKKSLNWAISSQGPSKEGQGSTIRESIRLGEIPKSSGLFAFRWMVSPLMDRFIGEHQIGNAIIFSIPINVMDKFFGIKDSSQMFFHYEPMESNISFAITMGMLGLSQKQITFFCENVARMVFIENRNFVFPPDLRYVVSGEIHLFSNFRSAQTSHRHLANFAYRREPFPNGDSINSHPLPDIWLAHIEFFGYLLKILCLIIVFQLFFYKWNFKKFAHKDYHITDRFYSQAKRRYDLDLSERVRR